MACSTRRLADGELVTRATQLAQVILGDLHPLDDLYCDGSAIGCPAFFVGGTPGSTMWPCSAGISVRSSAGPGGSTSTRSRSGDAERPTISASQALDLADRMPEQYRLLVLLAVFGSLRWGEVTALRRSDVDIDRGTVTVRGALSERSTGEMVLGPPKSAAGLRTVTLPAPVAEQLRVHLYAHVEHHDQAWIFSGTTSQPLRRSNFNKLVRWSEVVQQMGLTGLHFHDLRHTGNHLAAQTPGATLRDLMVRMGHGSMRAALIYQHASRDADRHIADSLGERLAPLWPAASGEQTDVRRADRPARRPMEGTQNARPLADGGRGRGGITRGGL